MIVGWSRAGADTATSLASRFSCPSAPSTPATSSAVPAPTPSQTPEPIRTTSVEAPSNLSGLCDPALQRSDRRSAQWHRGSRVVDRRCGTQAVGSCGGFADRAEPSAGRGRDRSRGRGPRRAGAGGDIRKRNGLGEGGKVTASAKRLLLVHAHPDDETITTGGTIARYASEGVEVTVLTCTLGEEGEVIGDAWGRARGFRGRSTRWLPDRGTVRCFVGFGQCRSSLPRRCRSVSRLRNDRHTFGRQSPCFCQCSTRRSSWRGGRRHS